MAFCCCFRAFNIGFPSALSPKNLTGGVKNEKMAVHTSETTNRKKQRPFHNRSHLPDRILLPDKTQLEHDDQVKKVKNIIRNLGKDLLELIMIDALHRLRIAHHFREEINAALCTQYTDYCSVDEENSHDLVEFALRFRLLRNEGYVIDANFKRGWMRDVEDLAKMESDMVQMQIQNEVLQISKWWRDLGLSKRFEFARILPLKWYMWPLVALPDLILSEQRVELVKSVSFVYLIDDIFDVYETLDELTSFTEAINRREESLIEELPDCVKLCFRALSSVINELSNRTYVKYGWNPTDSLWKAWADLCNTFLVEVRWFVYGEIPSTDEYLKNGIISAGVHVVLVHLFFLLGEDINHKNVDFLNKNHPCAPGAAILRLSDDLGSAKDENQDGHDGSFIACYMNEYNSTSIEDAHNHVTDMISDTWKELTEECLLSPRFCAMFCNACLNVARMVQLMYNYDDKHNLPILERHMKSLMYKSEPF